MDFTQQAVQRELKNFALSIVRNDEDAQEVVQDVMVRFLDQSPGKYSKSYLFKAVRNTSLNKLRSRSRYLKAKENFSQVVRFLFSENHEERTILEELIYGLPTHLREVLILRIKSELSHGEISEILEIPVGTVKSRINTAVKKMKKSIKEQGNV